MATKAEIKSAIQAQLTGNGGLTTHAQHEEFLHTETDSILENIYMTPVNETHSSNTITSDNANFNYDVNITKTGRTVHIVGTVTANASLSAGATMFSIASSEYQTAYQSYGKVIENGTTGGIQLSSNDLNLLQSVFELEVFFIDITYEVTN